jgi:hypothetical protein
MRSDTTSWSHNESGQALVMVLVFLTAFALLTAGVLAFSDLSLRNTSLVRARDSKVYAADAGIEDAIQRLRLDPSLCAGDVAPFDRATYFAPSVNGETIEVRCERESGSGLGAAGWAVITTEQTQTGLSTQSGGGGDRTIDGPVYASGISRDSSFSLIVTNGNVIERKQSSPLTCATDDDSPGGLTITPTPPYHYHCLSDDPSTDNFARPDPPHELPTAPPPDAGLPISDGTCTTFRPGTYTAANPAVDAVTHQLKLTAKNYFASGTYLFDGVDIVLDKDEEVVGGKRRLDEPVVNEQGSGPITACSDDSSVGVNDGTGVKLILGSSSRLLVNKKGSVELYARCAPTGCDPYTSTPADGTQHISLMAVPNDATAAWASERSTVAYGSGTPIVQVGSTGGSNPALTFHGLVYLRDGYMDFTGKNDSEAQIRSGIVVGRFLLQSSAHASGYVVTVGVNNASRRVIITSTAKGVGGLHDIRDISARAVVSIANDINKTVTVYAWRTDCAYPTTTAPTTAPLPCTEQN